MCCGGTGVDTYDVEGCADGPKVPAVENFALVPVVEEFEIGYVALITCVESTPAFFVDIHSFFTRLGLELDGFRAGDASVPEGSAGGHEERVVDVSRVGEDDEIEVEQPSLFPWYDIEVCGLEGRVGECGMQHGGEIMLKVFEGVGGEMRVGCWGTCSV